MLLTKDEVARAMNLTTAEVRAAMKEGGYGAEDIHDAMFIGMNPIGQFVYEITFPDPEGEDEAVGKVYLKFARKAFSRVHYLTGEF